MRKSGAILLLLASVAVFAIGLLWLFQMRFSGGDVYPPYSTLRADPLGAMAFYESLGRLPRLSVRRDISSGNKLPEQGSTTYFHLASDPEDWREMEKDLVKEIEGFMLRGGRFVVTFEPMTAGWDLGFTPPPTLSTNKAGGTNAPAGKSKTVRLNRIKKLHEQEEAERFADIEERWGYNLTYKRLRERSDGTAEPAGVLNQHHAGLPLELNWHSATVFTNVSSDWQIIYARNKDAVLMERKFGSGSLVLATDSYFVSNEALRVDRHADLLAWLAGSSREIVFDEAHFGILEANGVAVLMRKYRLGGLFAGIVVLLGLFIWKNSTSFLPPASDLRKADVIAGKEMSAGFVNLLRRNIRADQILKICFEEWTKSLRQRSNFTLAGVDRAQSVMEQEISRPSSGRDPVRAYREIAVALKRSKSSDPNPESKSHEPLTKNNSA